MTDQPFAIPDSYQVDSGLIAGEYPGDSNLEAAQVKVNSLLDAGVTCFVDLTEEGEHSLKPYAPLLRDTGGKMRAAHVRFPVRDLRAPSLSQMVSILDFIDERIEQGETVYVHCMGGTGRTGTVVGCYLARHDVASGESVVPTIVELRANTKKSGRPSPEMAEQIEMVSSWRVDE
jgi:hypothetical protein